MRNGLELAVAVAESNAYSVAVALLREFEIYPRPGKEPE